jgi:hypothetical protein
MFIALNEKTLRSIGARCADENMSLLWSENVEKSGAINISLLRSEEWSYEHFTD